MNREPALRAGPAEGLPRPSDAKRFGRNFASVALAQLTAQGLTFLASILLAQRLGVDAYGIFVFGFAFPSWFLTFVSLGLDEVISTDVAADRTRARTYLTLVFLVRSLCAGLAMVALWIAVPLVLGDPIARTVTLVLGSASVLSTYAGTFSALFRAFERLEYMALATVAERAFSVTAVVLLLRAGFGLVEASLAFLAGSLFLLFLTAIIARRRFAWFTRDVDARTLSRILRTATPFFLFNAVGTFAYSSGVVLLTFLAGPGATGLFNAGLTLLLAMFSFLSIFSLAALPMMSRVHGESRERLAAMLHRIQRLSVIFGVPLAFGGWYYAPAIVAAFYPSSFQASADVFRVLVVAFSIETAVLGNGPALAATGHAKEKFYVACAGVVVNVTLCLAFIPSMGPLGAAYAFLAGHGLSAALGFLLVRRYVARIGEWDSLAKALVAGSAMVLVLSVVPGLGLWAGVPLGALVYFATVAALRGATRSDGLVIYEGLRGALFR